MTTLAKGANTRVDSGAVRALLSWATTPDTPDVDVSALLLDGSGKVRDDDDLVFYNAPWHPSGAVTHQGKRTEGSTSTDTVMVDLASLPTDVDRVVIAASADGGTFGQVGGLTLVVEDATTAGEVARFDDMGATTETAFVAGELYRRDGSWKLRAVGQGYDSGLAGLATDFGITVDDDPAPVAPPAPAEAPAPAPASAPVPVNLDKGRVDLRKGERVSLVKTGAPALEEVVMGLGWDPAQRGRSIDLDASVIAFDAGGRRLANVWFMKTKAFGGAIRHSGDNVTGRGDGDDEQIRVRLADLPAEVHGLVFTINSFGGQKFTQVSRAFCRLVDAATNAELVRFDLTSAEARTGVLMCAVVRTPAGPWEMKALGTFHDGRTVKKLVAPAAAALVG